MVLAFWFELNSHSVGQSCLDLSHLPPQLPLRVRTPIPRIIWLLTIPAVCPPLKNYNRTEHHGLEGARRAWEPGRQRREPSRPLPSPHCLSSTSLYSQCSCCEGHRICAGFHLGVPERQEEHYKCFTGKNAILQAVRQTQRAAVSVGALPQQRTDSSAHAQPQQ